MEKNKSICMFCSMGCGFLLASERGIPSHIEYDHDDPVNKGSLCPRGNCAIELVKNTQRLSSPMIKMGGTAIESTWDEAVGFLNSKLKDIKKKYGANSIGVVVSPSLTNEEIYSAEVLARDVIKTANFDIAFSSDDLNLAAGLEDYFIKDVPTFKINDINDCDCLLIIGDLLSKAPCSSKNLMDAKYPKKATKVIVLEPKVSHTAWFATTHIRMKPGTEWLVVLGMVKSVLENKKSLKGKEATLKRILKDITFEDISEMTGVPTDLISTSAGSFVSSKKGVIIISTGNSRVHGLLGILSKILASISNNKKGIVPFYTYLNSNGASHVMKLVTEKKRSMTAPQMMEGAVSGRIKAIISFGADIVSMAKWGEILKKPMKLEMLAVTDIFTTRTTDAADVILPAASICEKRGSIVLGDDRVINVEEAISPLYGSRSEFDIIRSMALHFGKNDIGVKDLDKDIRSKRKASAKQISSRELEKIIKKSLSEREEGQIKPYLLIADEDIAHFTEGSYTKKFYWPQRVCGDPLLGISKALADEVGVVDGEEVFVKTRYGEMLIDAKVEKGVPDKFAFIPAHFIDVRNLFGRKVSQATGRIELEPIAVTIEKVDKEHA